MGSSGVTRWGRLAVTGLSVGGLATIWGGVWYFAMATGRLTPSEQALVGSRMVFASGLVSTVVAFAYLRANKLSVLDGSTTQELPAFIPAHHETAAHRGGR